MRYIVNIGTVSAILDQPSEELVEYLENFYDIVPITTGHPEAEKLYLWKIFPIISKPPEESHKNQWGVGIQKNIQKRELRIYCEINKNLHISVRKALRDVFLSFCENRKFTMLHAAAVYNQSEVLIFVGESQAGKTTLALDAILNRDYKLLSNDHLILYKNEEFISLTTLPTVITVRTDTYELNNSKLPNNFLEKDSRFYSFSFKQLQQNCLTILQPNNFNIKIFVVSWSDSSIKIKKLHGNKTSALSEHIRTKWMYEECNLGQFIPRDFRDRVSFLSDSQNLLKELIQCSDISFLMHAGEIPQGTHNGD